MPKPVSLIAVEAFRLESADGAATHIDAGTLVQNCDAELATIIVGAGKARVATADEIAEAGKPKKA